MDRLSSGSLSSERSIGKAVRSAYRAGGGSGASSRGKARAGGKSQAVANSAAVEAEASNEADGFALINAAGKGDLNTLRSLVERETNLDFADGLGKTPLMWAAIFGKLSCLDHLIDSGANVNAQTKSKMTALHWAATNDHAPCVESLIKAGAKASLKSRSGQTALDDARRCASEGHCSEEVVRLLENATAIRAQAKKAAVLKLAAERLLRQAAADNDLEALTSFAEKGVNLSAADDAGCTALMLAAGAGHHECVDLLIAKGAALNARTKGRENGMETALHLAATNGHAPCVVSLIKAGADARVVSASGNTALDYAKLNHHAEVARLLTKASAIAATEASRRWLTKNEKAAAEKALRNAAFSGDLDTLTELLDEGVDPDSTDKGGCTALMKAAGEGHRDCVDYLIAKGANLNAKSKSKHTALHFIAATNGNAACAESLLKAGAKRNLKNVGGETALDIAKENGKTEVARLLEETNAARPTHQNQARGEDDVDEAHDEHARACARSCCTVS